MKDKRLLTGWKDIANYLGVSVKTAKRYYKKYGLPVLRLPTGKPCINQNAIQLWLEKRKKLL